MTTSHSDFFEDNIVVNKFNEDSARDFRKRVLKISQLDPTVPIIVYIDSYGGYVDSLNSMLSTMRQVPNQFITVCIGKAMSCGAALLAAGDFRFCDESSRVMVHEVSCGAVGNIDDVQSDARESARLNTQIMTMIAQRCGKTYQQLKQKIKDNEGRDLYFTAKTAKEFGIVDFIGLPIVKPIVLYSIESVPQKAQTKINTENKATSGKKKIINKSKKNNKQK